MAKGESVAKAAGRLAAAIVKDADQDTGAETEKKTETETDLDNALNEVPEGVISVEVWQLLEGAEKAYAGKYDPEGFVDAVADRVGPGRYLGIFRKIGKDSKRVIAGQRRFTITPGLKPNPAAAPAPAALGLGEMSEVKKMMQSVSELIQGNVRQGLEQQNLVSTMQTAMLKSMVEGGNRGPSIVEIITALGPIVAPLIAGLMAPRAGGMTPEFMLTLVDRMTKQVPAGDLDKTLGLIERLKDIAGGEGSENAPVWLKSAEKLLGIVGDELQARRVPGGVPAARPAAVLSMPTVTRPAAPAAPGDPAPAPEPTREAAPVPAGSSQLVNFVAPYIPMLLTHAELNHDPDTYAGFLLDAVAPGYHAVLGSMLEGDVLPEFTTAFPAIAPFSPWFGELLDAIRERLKPEEEEK